MKLPSQKYRNAAAAVINDVLVWRNAWLNAEAGAVKSAQYRVWFVEAKQRLALDLGIWLYSDDTEESLAAELADALNDLDTCKWCEQVREAAEAEKAEREAATEAAAAAERPDVSTYVPVLQTTGGKQIRVWKYQTADYDLAQDYCQRVYDAQKHFGYVETVLLDEVVYTAEEYEKLKEAMFEQEAA